MKNKNTLSGTSALVKQEAERFLLNAAEIFSTKGKLEDGYFSDKKYVKMASHAAYTGVLYALDAALKLPKKNRNDIREYYKALSVENKKMNKHFEYLYATFHLDGGYDGIARKVTVIDALKVASEVIDWCATKIA